MHGLSSRLEAKHARYVGRAGARFTRRHPGGIGARQGDRAGKARESELVRRLADPDEDRRMPLQDKPLSPPQWSWCAAGSTRARPEAQRPRRRGKAAASPPRKVRWVRSLDVPLPCEVKLAAGSLDAPKGGRSGCQPAGGPATGGDGTRIPR